MYLYAVPVTLNVLFFIENESRGSIIYCLALKGCRLFFVNVLQSQIFKIYLIKKYWLVNQSIFKKNCKRFVRYWNIRTFSEHFLSFQIIWPHSSNEPYLTGILTVQ